MSFLTKEIKEDKNDDKKNKWTREQEELLAKWADKAICYRWLHDNSEKKFYKKNMWIAIPVITLSTLAGVANFGTEGIFTGDLKEYSNIIIGSISVLTSLWSTYGNFLGYAQKMESHRLSMIAWSKFNRNISVELALSPEERHNPIDFINICRAELDRLVEASPSIPDDIINKFEEEFQDVDITRPEVCHNLEKTKIYMAQDLKTIVEKETASRLDYLSQKGLLNSEERASNLANKFSSMSSFIRKNKKKIQTDSVLEEMKKNATQKFKENFDIPNLSLDKLRELDKKGDGGSYSSINNLPTSSIMEKVMENFPYKSDETDSQDSDARPVNSIDDMKFDSTPTPRITAEITKKATEKAGEVAAKATNKFLESLFNSELKNMSNSQFVIDIPPINSNDKDDSTTTTDSLEQNKKDKDSNNTTP